MEQERRKWVRFFMDLFRKDKVSLTIGGFSASGAIADVSPGGIRVVLDGTVSAKVGGKVGFVGGDGEIGDVLAGVEGEIRWVGQSDRTVGILFDKPLEMTNAELLEMFGN